MAPSTLAGPGFEGEYKVIPAGFPLLGVGAAIEGAVPTAVGVVPLGTILRHFLTSFFKFLANCLSTSAT